MHIIMNTLPFKNLLLKTAFCCMAADGHIADKEITQLKLMYEKSPLFDGLNFEEEINKLIVKLNTRGKEFIHYYFELLEKSDLSEQEELNLLDFAIQTIHSDGIDEYSEIKFFKNIRHRLNVSDEKILEINPEVEYWLEEDIKTDSFLDKITNHFLDTADLPQFEFITIDTTLSDKSE